MACVSDVLLGEQGEYARLFTLLAEHCPCISTLSPRRLFAIKQVARMSANPTPVSDAQCSDPQMCAPARVTAGDSVAFAVVRFVFLDAAQQQTKARGAARLLVY